VSEFLRNPTTQRWRGLAPPASSSLIAPICAHLVARNRADRPAPSFACTSAPDEHSQRQQTATHCNTLQHAGVATEEHLQTSALLTVIISL